MKMLFSSSTSLEAEVVRRKLLDAGIACEVRVDAGAEDMFPVPVYPELWIKNDDDFQTALKLCMRLGPRSVMSAVETRKECFSLSSLYETDELLACC
jgi:hypothetical protein